MKRALTLWLLRVRVVAMRLWIACLAMHGVHADPMTATERQKGWWAFQPLQAPAVPRDPSAASARVGPIDAFIRSKLVERGLNPAPPANRHTWLRRVTFDLIGLPPTPQEVQSFQNDPSALAFETVVDRLLASPQFGERWARHWMDVVRYADYYDADPKTRTASCELTEAWRYRDWLVRAFNQDLPYDQFILHQIAGDLLPSPEGLDFYADGLIATTFLSNGVWDRGDADKEKIVSDMVDDQIDTVGKAFLGLTLGCARCHDHKFDPVSQEDYYALAGMFYSAHLLKDLGAKGAEYVVNRVPLAPKAEIAARQSQLDQLERLRKELAPLQAQTNRTLEITAQHTALRQRIDTLERSLAPEPPLAMAMQEGGTPGGLFPGIQDVPLHIRGSYSRPGAIVPRRLPSFFAPSTSPPLHGSGRRELATWIASTNQPLTARVIVNRVWHWHFGEGLVRTPGNLGLLSEPPTHPELLDWLARRFVDGGWSLKRLHREIVLSETYRQSSHPSQGTLEADPDNRWLAYVTPRRLEAESIRDALLAVTSELDRHQGGPAETDLTAARRSIYVQTARWDRSGFATLFDAANPDASVDRRNVSIVAPQSLFLLNHPFMHRCARALAERRLAQHLRADEEMLRDWHWLLYGRDVQAAEISLFTQWLQQHAGEEPLDRWQALAHILLCANEFVHVD